MKFRLVSVIAACMMFGAMSPVFALDTDDANSITFFNKLPDNRVILYLFSSAQDSSFWGCDLLKNGVPLQNGGSVEYDLYYPDQSTCLDILAIDNAGNLYKISGITVQDGTAGQVAIEAAQRTVKSDGDFGLVEISIDNQTGENLEYLFFAPQDTKTWGIDLLDKNSTLDKGNAQSFYLPQTEAGFTMEALFVDTQGREYTKNLQVKPGDDSLSVVVSPKDMNL